MTPTKPRIPEGWKETPLKAVLQEVDVRVADLSPKDQEGIEVLSLTKQYGLIPQAERFNKRVATENVDKYKVIRRDWIVYNPYVIWEGAVHSLKRDQPGIVSPVYPVWEVRQPDGGYVDLLLRTPEVIEKYQSLSSGAVNRRRSISKEDFLGITLPLPPLPEQKKIAHILSTVQRAIEAQERIIQTTTELKKALMHKLFTEGLRHESQKQTEIGPVPESWATPTVESVCAIKASAMSYSQLENAPNVPNGVRVVGIKVSDMNLPGNEIEFRSANLERQLPEKEALKRTVPANSIVFPKRGAAIATNKKRLTTGRTVLDPNLIAVMPTKAVNHRYLFHWFNTFDLKKITDPGPTPQLNKKDIAPLKFPMPPVEEQEEISAAIDAAEEKATLHSRKRDQFQDLFRALLHELMTAKTRVHELQTTA